MGAGIFRGWSTPHGTALIAVLLVCLGALLMLPGCSDPPPLDTCSCEDCDCGPPLPAPPASAPSASATMPAHEVVEVAAEVAAEAQQSAAAIATPAIVAAQDALQSLLPAPAARREPVPPLVSPAAVALIVREEIISPAYYAKALQGTTCPGDHSGPTVGIGSDLGVQTRARIADTWSIHPTVDRLQTASGRIGFGPCREWRTANIDIRTPLPLAQEVFASKLLPRYHRLAARAFRNGWDRLPPDAQGGLVATVYVRGDDMTDAPGSQRRAEMRVMRDVCVPAGDLKCLAAQHRAMCQRFVGRKDAVGLCRRFTRTAQLIEAAA